MTDIFLIDPIVKHCLNYVDKIEHKVKSSG